MNHWLLCLMVCCAPPPTAEETRAKGIEDQIEFVTGDDPTRVVVRGLMGPLHSKRKDGPVPELDGRRSLALTLLDETTSPPKEGPPLFGSYELRDGMILFTPRFGLTRGLMYRATSRMGGQDSPGGINCILWSANYRVPESSAASATQVETVFPSAERLPANLLKFGIVFSRPMREGREVFEHIHLVDSAGKKIPAPWRDIELWNAEATLLSLYIHPGRIKQGVNLREDLGPVLKPNESYTLVVDAAMRDAVGKPLEKEFRKSFQTGPELRTKIDVAAWKITLPDRDTLAAVAVETDRIIDAWSTYPNFAPLTILDAKGHPVAAARRISPTRFEYGPKEPWLKGTYRIVVDSKLTDLAGNTPHTVFDRDLESRADDPSTGPIERTFTIP